MKLRKLFILLISLVVPFFVSATTQVLDQEIKWTALQNIQISENTSVARMYFEGAFYDDYSPTTPVYRQKIKLEGEIGDISAQMTETVFEPLTSEEILTLENLPEISTTINLKVKLGRASKKAVALVEFLPFRLNNETGKYEKLVAFNLVLTTVQATTKAGQSREYAENSVLSSGKWFKIKVNKSGVYKVTTADLTAMGINVASVNTANLRLYGNGGGMLPEKNSEFRFDDLQENAIEVVDGGDGKFNDNDYFLFYGEAPDAWKPNAAGTLFNHQRNIYADYTCYFITTDLGAGKRILNEFVIGITPNITISQFNDYDFYEKDNVNLIKSGREWYGDLFDLQTTLTFPFTFPNIDVSAFHHVNVKVVAQSSSSSTFVVSINGEVVTSMIVPAVSANPNGYYARTVSSEKPFVSSAPEVNVTIKYNKSPSTSTGWLDFIEVNVIRNLVFTSGQMGFRSLSAVGANNISEFSISNAAAGLKVWDVTDPTNVIQREGSLEGSTLKITVPTPELLQFMAFDGSEFLSAEFVETIENQNLHALKNIEYVIVSHPDFLDQANRLADFHKTYSNLTVAVCTPQSIYNEFSSGSQDLTAIKDFMRMLYERSGESGNPKYLLLFGDASYDFKDILPVNSNFIPTYESDESLHFINSFATDDYFGFLDPEESVGSGDLLDIGIGRFVVQNTVDAKMAVDKVIHYATSANLMGDWRNVLTFTADDEDGNVHMTQAEQLATFVDTSYRSYNIDKIYLDSYQQASTPGGQRYPDVNAAISSRIEKGTLIINYTGHGGEVGWAHERVLEVSDINSWTNWDKLAVFLTATCEFTRYDDPNRISAGEYVFLNPNGGGISLFTTARATFGGSNLSLNKGFYKHAFDKIDGEHYAMGDLIRLAKLESSSESNDMKFVLLGDPALKIAYPKYSIETLSINENPTTSAPDTLKALSDVSISGEILDGSGKTLSSFNGTIYSIVYDKESIVTTLGQDDESSPKTFKLRKNIIYKGKAQIIDGKFSYAFVVPKDIAYEYGTGKISYYAENGIEDASGFQEDLIIGGFDDSGSTDDKAPEIELFMNNEDFRSGDITDSNPVLFAKIFDESGINTVGNGIGHDIVAVLDNNNENQFILNDFYEAQLNSYKSGDVSFPFFNLEPGEHEVSVKLWDVYNNSAEAQLRFVVVDGDNFTMNQLINYPNPFKTETYFKFNHNKPGTQLDVKIEIYDLSGRLVATLSQQNMNDGYYSTPIKWDGDSSGGASLRAGIYIYYVKATDEAGQTISSVKKLIIAR
jgi:hypothetical protein